MSPTEQELQQALAQLPHGPEFRFLDRLTALDRGRSGAGEYRVRAQEPFLKGHFPGRPILPGVLMVEAAAQLAGTVAQSDLERPPLADLRLTALRNIKIHGAAEPESILIVEARITGRLGMLVQSAVRVTSAGRLLLEGELTLSGTSDSPALRPPA